MNLSDVLNYKEKTLESVMGYVRPTLDQVMGLSPMPVSKNITPPEPPKPQPIEKPKATIMDRLKGIKDKVFKK